MSLLDHPVIHLLRHGQTALNAAELVCGATDIPLTSLGRRQADDAARAWRNLPIGRLIVSPLLRARQTADAFVRQRPGLRVEVAPLLAERDWGAWEGQPRAVLARDATPYGGEGPLAFRDRIRAGLIAIAAPAVPEDPPLIVAHSGTVREIMALLALPFHRPRNCELLTLSRDDRGTWSATPPRPTPDTPASNSKRIA
ncbi:histidine phosphatase family protein [Paracoccus rhizosphaerae]|uniref:Histidine phosphatase family protein n=1 Tax=Paracoccus rhizosphaerae TaxID=1133347 RepID=A0ABV6CKB8_9RHOB|nr:histidine phosphatase family protein [Paracoccus rhizosphaerae]